jgi:two-component system, NarL family, response regulator DevR
MKPKIRLMVVDDHEVVRLGLSALFRQTSGIEVVAEAGSVADAVKGAAQQHPDVVLMDLRLPDGTGIDACRDILSAQPGTRVLFLTSHSDEEAVVSTILAGAAGYLLKEVGSQALVDAIELVHSGQSILDPKVTTAVLRRMSMLDGKVALAKQPSKDILSPQERRILALVVEGKTNKEIAKALGLSDKTVKNYLSNAFQKLHVGRRSHAAALYTRDIKD